MSVTAGRNDNSAARLVVKMATMITAVLASSRALTAAQIAATAAIGGTTRSTVSVSVRGTIEAINIAAHTTHSRIVTPSSNDSLEFSSASANKGPAVKGKMSHISRKIHVSRALFTELNVATHLTDNIAVWHLE